MHGVRLPPVIFGSGVGMSERPGLGGRLAG
jgi:hypothetical protein